MLRYVPFVRVFRDLGTVDVPSLLALHPGNGGFHVEDPDLVEISYPPCDTLGGAWGVLSALGTPLEPGDEAGVAVVEEA